MKDKVPQNIDVFNRIVATCILQLYEKFPVPVDIDPGDVAMKAIQDDIPEGELFKILTDQSPAAIDFLAAEGFLRFREDFRTLSSRNFPQAQLTMKGLSILGAVPNAVDAGLDRRTLAEQLRESVNSGAKDALKNTVGTMFSAALGIGFRTILSISEG